ncbi:hypothetical protein ACFYWY_32365 [Streptomyces sp. NPDC002870]|uniref:hypothetical protein n=1 Tax=Streptomyces sp. NPDC002870 TaxID=3364666 RepID=UPI0036788022
MASDLERGVGELKKFRTRVDTVLAELESGDGGKTKVAAERVTRGSFGVGLPFAEAEGFYKEYNRVHKALVTLSKSLGDQIELLTIGVHAADVGYDNVEVAQRARFHEIKARLDRERDQAIEREQAQPKPAQPAQPRQDAKTGTEDLG